MDVKPNAVTVWGEISRCIKSNKQQCQEGLAKKISRFPALCFNNAIRSRYTSPSPCAEEWEEGGASPCPGADPGPSPCVCAGAMPTGSFGSRFSTVGRATALRVLTPPPSMPSS